MLDRAVASLWHTCELATDQPYLRVGRRSSSTRLLSMCSGRPKCASDLRRRREGSVSDESPYRPRLAIAPNEPNSPLRGSGHRHGVRTPDDVPRLGGRFRQAATPPRCRMVRRSHDSGQRRDELTSPVITAPFGYDLAARASRCGPTSAVESVPRAQAPNDLHRSPEGAKASSLGWSRPFGRRRPHRNRS